LFFAAEHKVHLVNMLVDRQKFDGRDTEVFEIIN
jgi:hypothetical protein